MHLKNGILLCSNYSLFFMVVCIMLLFADIWHGYVYFENRSMLRQNRHLFSTGGISIQNSSLTKWGVITTIFEVNQAVRHFVETFQSYGLVVVGDKKTNHTEWFHFAKVNKNVHYLDPNTQVKWQTSTINAIPWNHFGRKTIGYLYAIYVGAVLIYDFDDDNHLLVNTFKYIDATRVDVLTKEHIYNPYPYFQPKTKDGSKAFVWPRGFPQQFINDKKTYMAPTKNSSEKENLAIIQSLANHDPDVDAIYRMTRTLPLTFTKKDTTLVIPHGTFVPWNAQAVLVNTPAFFGMVLPVTVPGRVSDIWRSYIMTRLLWETDYKIGFVSAFVVQYRNPHNYQHDLIDEHDLYYKCDDLLATLAGWTSDKIERMDTAYLDLVQLLVKKEFLKSPDFVLAKAWVSDLNSMGYKWPAITRRYGSFQPRIPKIVDQRYKAKEYYAASTPSNSTLMFKRFVYLIQSPSPKANSRLRPTADRDVMYACFKEKCVSSGLPSEDILLAYNTSWCTGRNALLEFALKRSKNNNMSNGKGYDYYIFLDDDITDQISGDNPWNMFEFFLLSKKPAVGYFLRAAPNNRDSRKTKLQNFIVDANVNAFHRTTLGSLLPYDCSLDHVGIYFSAYIQNMVVASMFSSKRIAGCPEIVFNKSKNRHNTNSRGYIRSVDWDIPEKYLSMLFTDQKTRDMWKVIGRYNRRWEDWKLCQQQPLTGPITSTWVAQI